MVWIQPIRKRSGKRKVLLRPRLLAIRTRRRVTFQTKAKPFGCLAILMVFTLSLATQGCAGCSTITEFTIVYPNTTESCQKCKNCPVGYGLPRQCGNKVPNGISLDCVPCLANISYSDTDDAVACKPCHECIGRNVLRQCTSRQNRECDFTQCLPNYYLDNMADPSECKECHFCCDDVAESERLQECKHMPKNQQCKRNRQCKLSATAASTTHVSTGPPVTTTHKLVNKTVTGTHSTISVVDPSTPPPASTIEEEGGGTSSSSTDGDTTSYAIIIIGATVPIGVICLSLVYALYRKTRSDQRDHRDGMTKVVVRDSESSTDPGLSEDNAVSESDHPAYGLRLSEISLNLEQILSLELDVSDSDGEYRWKKLGNAFEIEKRKLKYLETAYKREGSPTKELLEILNTSQDRTVGDLINKLNGPQVNLPNVALDIRQHIGTGSHEINSCYCS